MKTSLSDSNLGKSIPDVMHCTEFTAKTRTLNLDAEAAKSKFSGRIRGQTTAGAGSDLELAVSNAALIVPRFSPGAKIPVPLTPHSPASRVFCPGLIAR